MGALAEAGGVPGVLPAASREDVRAAARSISAAPGSLEQVGGGRRTYDTAGKVERSKISHMGCNIRLRLRY